MRKCKATGISQGNTEQQFCFVLDFRGDRLNFRFKHIQMECPGADIDGLDIERIIKCFDRKNDFHHWGATRISKAQVKTI